MSKFLSANKALNEGTAAPASTDSRGSAKTLKKKRVKIEVTADMLLGPNGFSKLGEDLAKLVGGWSQAGGNEVYFVHAL